MFRMKDKKLYLETKVNDKGEICVNVNSQTGLTYTGKSSKLRDYGDTVPLNEFEAIVKKEYLGDYPISIVDLQKETGLSRPRLNALIHSGSLQAIERCDGLLLGDLEAAVTEIRQVVGEANRGKARTGLKARWSKTDPSSGSVS